MKNPYLRSILKISLIISILFTVSEILGTWAESYSTSHFVSVDMTTSTWTTIEAPNIYHTIYTILDHVQLIILGPLYIVFPVLNYFIIGVLFVYIGPTIVFILWFFVLYVVTYIFAKFIRKNLISAAPKHTQLIWVCILTTIILSAGQMLYLYIL